MSSESRNQTNVRRYGTTMESSFDGRLTPKAFTPRMRAKYRPGGTPLTVVDDAAPTATVARVCPGAKPTWSTKDATMPPPSVHDSATV